MKKRLHKQFDVCLSELRVKHTYQQRPLRGTYTSCKFRAQRVFITLPHIDIA